MPSREAPAPQMLQLVRDPEFPAGRAAAPVDWLLVPSPNGIANLGQLAADVAIQTLKMQRVGWIDTELFVPFACNDAFGAAAGRLHYACELYATVGPAPSVAVLQIRSPLVPSETARALALLATRLPELPLVNAATTIAILSGVDATLRTDEQIRGLGTGPAQVLASPPLVPALDAIVERLGALSLAAGVSKPSGDAQGAVGDLSRWVAPGSGLGRALYERISATQRSLLILYPVVEGDNQQDALRLASLALALVHGGDPALQLAIPDSWSSLFGPMAHQDVLY